MDDPDLANWIAENGKINQYRKDEILLEQGKSDNDIHFILSGRVSIVVNGRHVADCKAGTHVGEVTLLDTRAQRSATTVATEPTTTLSLRESQFDKLAERHSVLWKRIAIETAKRFRERDALLRPPHSIPALFIGSSSEGLKIASKLYKRLAREPLLVVPHLWKDDVFHPTQAYIESLVNFATDEADFAVLVFKGEDRTISRGKSKLSPRDNVVFELGLFMGALGRKRVLILKPRGADLRIPSDLSGVTCLEYHEAGPKTLSSSLDDSCKTIFNVVRKLRSR